MATTDMTWHAPDLWLESHIERCQTASVNTRLSINTAIYPSVRQPRYLHTRIIHANYIQILKNCPIDAVRRL